MEVRQGPNWGCSAREKRKHSLSQGFLDYYIFNVRRKINTALLTILSRTRLKECVISFVNNYIIISKLN
jgi:hypothetical protein